MRTIAARMNYAFGYAFMVKVENLFTQGEIFQQRRAECADPQRILVVRNNNALCGGQPFSAIGSVLMDLATGSAG